IIKNVNNKIQTPLWMVEKLRRSGIGSISFFVDVTNYVMLLTGQPMHAVDLDKLEGRINVRYAINNEELTLLDQTQVKLD
ncbi:B3/4 domain-containing protein, partial [Francisella tularensis]|uniref:B3/4 domain-containing protein n=1 Tax=Francisella tularensis TaxID=263 RepID=UPI002381AA55